jgi:C1A family cysteine protease
MNKIKIKGTLKGMGWIPDYPDFRDFTEEHEKIKPMIQQMGMDEPLQKLKEQKNPLRVGLPTSVDLKAWCSPIEDQGSLGSCTAHAGVGLVEYYERRAFGRHIDASRLFLYKVTRKLLHWTGDTGAYIRTTMGAMVIFGVPPEEYWPYVIAEFDEEPPAFCYAFAQAYQAIRYLRLDPPSMPKDILLAKIKTYLAAGLPSMFGFTVYSSIWQASDDGKIPYPCATERVLGGHAVMAVGYDDNMRIKNHHCGVDTTGALLIRNSWGTDWGDNGYGWLPYEYVLKGLAVDWWTLLKQEWVDTGKFKLDF